MLTFRHPRKDFWLTLTAEEQELVRQHLEYLAELQEKGTVKFAGRDEDAAIGIAIVEVESREEAERILLGSPAVVAGMYTGELARYSMPLG